MCGRVDVEEEDRRCRCSYWSCMSGRARRPSWSNDDVMDGQTVNGRMGDFEAPSFSLGFDFHFGTSEPQIVPNITSNRDSADVPLASDVKTFVDGNDDDDDEFEIETLNVADSELQMMMKTMRCCSRG
ncbi:hypothetical protein Tco_0905383 [Tanacetum coccineum]